MAKKNFTFRLQKLLNYRETLEKMARLKLAEAEHRLRVENEKMQELIDEENRAIAEITPRKGQIVDPLKRISTEGWLVEHRKRQTMQQWNIDEAQQAVVAAEAAHKKSMQDIKVLEKLREKQREEFRLEQLREEQIFLDDLASQQFIRLAAAESREADALARDETALTEEIASNVGEAS